MKKNLFYYCLAISLIIHLLIIIGIRLERPEKKEKEPVIVDVLGPLKWGPKTVLPAGKKPPETRTASLKPKGRPAPEMPRRNFRPSFPSIPIPQATRVQKPAPAAAGVPPSPGDIASRAQAGQGGTSRVPAAPSPQAARGRPGPAAPPSTRRGLMLPTQEDLEKYAQADTAEMRRAKKDAVTLDTDDLMYTSYLQGLKRRIELIWKYPETARRDGLQGSLIMRFSIGKSGKLESVEIVRSSGYPMLDEAAKQALEDANPYNPLPDNWHKTSFTITGTFIYKIYGLYGKPYLE